MINDPLVAIHIVTHNSSRTIKQCLQTVETQTIDYELVIWDNASTDNTVDCVQQLGYAIHINETNIGYSKAHNQLLHLTTASYILTLNPDVALSPQFIENLLVMIHKYPTIGTACGLLERVEELGQYTSRVDSAGLYMRPWHQTCLRYEGKKLSDVPNPIATIFGADGSAALYNREMLIDIAFNGEVFDEDFFMHKEDIDICWRAQLRGWETIFIAHAKAQHIRSFRPGQRHRVDKSIRMLSVRNRYLLLIKHWRWELIKQNLLAILLYEIGILVYILLREQSSFTAYIEAFKLRKVMHIKSLHIRQTQSVPDKALLQWFHPPQPILRKE